MTEYSKSATSRNESLLSISLEDNSYSFSHSQTSHDSSSVTSVSDASSRDDVFEDASEVVSRDPDPYPEEGSTDSEEDSADSEALSMEDLEIISLDSEEEHADLNQSGDTDSKSHDKEESTSMVS